MVCKTPDSLLLSTDTISVSSTSQSSDIHTVSREASSASMTAPSLSSNYEGDDDDNLSSVSVESSLFQCQGSSYPVTATESVYHHETHPVGMDTLKCHHPYPLHHLSGHSGTHGWPIGTNSGGPPVLLIEIEEGRLLQLLYLTS